MFPSSKKSYNFFSFFVFLFMFLRINIGPIRTMIATFTTLTEFENKKSQTSLCSEGFRLIPETIR